MNRSVVVIIGCFGLLIVLFFSLALMAFAPSYFVGNNSKLSGGLTDDSDLAYPSTINDEKQAGLCLDNYIKQSIPKSPLYGLGINLINSGKSGNVNPGLLVAIGRQESALGTTSGVAEHNYYGLMSTEGGLKKFSNWNEAVEHHGLYIRRMYLNDKLTTIELIGGRYAPLGVSNDPKNLNKNWVPGVTKFFQEIKSTCPEFEGEIIPGSSFVASGELAPPLGNLTCNATTNNTPHGGEGHGFFKFPGTRTIGDGAIDLYKRDSLSIAHPVYASHSGKIQELFPHNNNRSYGYGGYVIKINGGKFKSVYAHIKPLSGIAKGSDVQKGQQIAVIYTKDMVPRLGFSTPHLHYEIFVDNISITKNKIKPLFKECNGTK